MRIYETGFVLAPSLAEEDIERTIHQMAEIVTQRQGRLIKQEKWGKRKLAYPIKKFTEGFYVFFLYEGQGDIPLELERRFKQTDMVLRYLTVRKEGQVRTAPKKKRARGEEPLEAEEMTSPEPAAEAGGGAAESKPGEN